MNLFLLFLRSVTLLALFELELAVVHDTANRWVRIGSHFHQVQVRVVHDDDWVFSAELKPDFFEAGVGGDELADFYIGRAYWNGVGVEQQRRRALPYFRRAADRGITEAFRYLGYAAIFGHPSSDQPVREAYTYFAIAAALRDPPSARELGELRKKLDGTLPPIPGVKLQVGESEWDRRRRGNDDRRIVNVSVTGDDPEYLEVLAVGGETQPAKQCEQEGRQDRQRGATTSVFSHRMQTPVSVRPAISRPRTRRRSTR